MSDVDPINDEWHPRRTATLFGHAAAERTLAESFASGRMPHAWLFSGPRGIGKATLAYRMARHVLASGIAAPAGGSLFGAAPPPATGLAVAPDDPLFRRVLAGGHTDLVTIERQIHPKTGKLREGIAVEDARKLPEFFALTAGEGGYRVAIVDAADDLNRHSANALLKIVEEPPARSLILIVAHSAGAVLPTVRSRCRRLALQPLDDAAMAGFLDERLPDLTDDERQMLLHLAEGSPGRAINLARLDAVALFTELIGLLSGFPRFDVGRLHRFAEARGRGADGGFHTAMDLLSWWLARMTRGAGRGRWPAEIMAGEHAAMQRMAQAASLDRWVQVWENVNRLLERRDAVNLDNRQVVLSAFFAISRAARGD